ncbi:MAG: O-succinylbenzoate synthase [Myxococcales bacterium]|nr:O-succinylbenzoate synthase [Myxococcales bacterium]
MLALARLTAWGGDVDPAHAVGSRRSWALRHGLLLALEDAAGRRGLGEGTPLPGLSRESVSDARVALAALDWSRLDPREVADGRGPELTASLPSSARFAVETACVDLVGRAEARPASRVLGGAPASGTIPVNALVGHVDDPELPKRAAVAVRRGALVLKVKLGGRDLDAERSALRALRDEVGASIRVRADLGGVLAADTAKAWLDALAEVGLEAVEEPCGGAALLAIGTGRTPWLADESLADAELRERLITAPACAGVVLKPTLLGGMMACLAIARRAQDNGKTVTITHAFEGPVARAACAALALAVRADLAGLDEHAGLEAFPSLPCAALPAVAPLGVRATDAPGLGLRVEEATLDGLPWSELWRR